ncbi:uncharacterized protein At2g34460, chloroplastic [Syzygium oleosum]|uniref:uncharacterized protein At2g34460, chloroplastic n=1 Tax=Syzygium oleosum TaxID=219896 RepID=UPI0024BBACB5|nr:uncharacterized protein At2g34460, chloroplastic [Syzygium oleosum]
MSPVSLNRSITLASLEREVKTVTTAGQLAKAEWREGIFCGRSFSYLGFRGDITIAHDHHRMATPSILSLRATTSHFLVPSSPPFSFSLANKPKSSSPSFSNSLNSIKMMQQGNEITEEEAAGKAEANAGPARRVFVAGATGSTGKRIVDQLLAKGFAVKAGVRDVGRARAAFPQNNPALQIVKADVTEGSEKLAEAIGGDSEAVICATGFRPGWDLFAPWKVDNFGTVNLVEACRKLGVNRFILISSILVNGAAMGQLLNPAYIFLNVFGLTLVAKLQAEQHIRRSGINYTIVRPGGLRNEPPKGNIVMEPEDTLYEGSISRDQVAEVAVEALNYPESSYKVVEIVAREDAPKRSFEELFGSVKQR